MRRRPETPNRIAATAAKDSQKPGSLTAKGSRISTASRARPRPVAGATRRLLRIESIRQTTITRARWVGTENPASAA